MSNGTETAVAEIPGPIDPQVAAAIQMSQRLVPLKNALNIAELSDQEMDLFAMVCQRTQLDPFAKEIYAIKRKGKVTFQTGIDGFRTAAERTGEYRGSDEPVYGDIVPKAGNVPAHPAFATVTVHRLLPDGSWVHQSATAYWDEFYPGAGSDSFIWDKMPRGQLAKCAEAQAFRKGFPRRMHGVYVDAEMDQAGAYEGQSARVVGGDAPRTAREIAAARRAEIEAQSSAAQPAAAGEAGATSPALDGSVSGDADSPEVEPAVLGSAAPSGATDEAIEGTFTEAPAPSGALSAGMSDKDLRAWLRDRFIGLTDAQKHIRATWGDEATIASITDEQRAETAAAVAHLARS